MPPWRAGRPGPGRGRTPWYLWGRRGSPCGPLPHVRDKFSDPPWSVWTRRGGLWFPSSPATWGQRAGPEGGRPHRRAGGGIHRHRCQRPVRRGRVGPERGMAITDRVLAKEVSAALLEGRPVGFASDFGHPARRASPQARRSWGCGSPTGRGGPFPAPCVWYPGA